MPEPGNPPPLNSPSGSSSVNSGNLRFGSRSGRPGLGGCRRRGGGSGGLHSAIEGEYIFFLESSRSRPIPPAALPLAGLLP